MCYVQIRGPNCLSHTLTNKHTNTLEYSRFNPARRVGQAQSLEISKLEWSYFTEFLGMLTSALTIPLTEIFEPPSDHVRRTSFLLS